jgi:uncharacterized protein YbaR (Trm112 family)
MWDVGTRIILPIIFIWIAEIKENMDSKLLAIMACPKCKGDIRKESMFLTCKKCKLAYPILNDSVPDMLIEDAWKLDRAKKAKFKHIIKL